MKKGLFTLLLLVVSNTFSYAQQWAEEQWEYQAYPDLPYILNHMELALTIEPEISLIKGVGIFTITSRRPGLTEIVFNTTDLEIQEISTGDAKLDFRVSADSLFIQLPDTLKPREKTEILITWESNSYYGIHKDVYGNLWTSLNPKSRSHWIPVPDHPEIETTLEASLTIPAEQEVVINGSLMGDEVVSTDQKMVRWSSKTAIPVSGLSLALGNFEKESARSGVKEVSIYASGDVLMEKVRSGLLEIAVAALKKYERKFSFEFPYDALQIVVLPDHYWNEIQSGAGIIYAYQSLGSLSTQIRRGIAEQWFGNFHRYLESPDHKYEFLKAIVAGTEETGQLLNADELQSVHRWNLWEQGVDNLEDDYLKAVILESLPELIRSTNGVTGWNEYAAFWYDETGMFWKDLPNPQLVQNQPAEELVYHVEYKYDEMNATLKLVFEALNQPIETLAGVEVTEYGFSDTTRSEISFTGTKDSVSVNISPGIDYLILNPVSGQKLKLEERKPFIFLIRQLRSTDSGNQIQAANQLKNYTENPDLQLALRDVLRDEDNAEVRAALLETLAEITQGASGTEQTFLENLNSENLSIKLTGLEALVYYPGNDQVSYSVQNVLLRAETDTVFNTALNTFKKIASAEELLSVAERLEQAGQKDEKALRVLKAAAPSDTSRKTTTIADRYALGNFPYSIRKPALKLLIEYQKNEEYWAQTLEMLLEDPDPRVRYHSLDAVQYLPEEQRTSILENRAEEELDPRVFKKIRDLLN